MNIIYAQETLTQSLEAQPINNVTFLSVLLATLTPALLIVIAYLLIKMLNKK